MILLKDWSVSVVRPWREDECSLPMVEYSRMET